MSTRGLKLAVRGALALALVCLAATAGAAEKVSIKIGAGQPQLCDVLKISKSGVTLKTGDGKEQTLPLMVLDAKEVLACYQQVLDPKNAVLRFDMGSFFAKKKLLAEAEAELNAAVALDPKLSAQAEPILKQIAASKGDAAKPPAIKEPAKDPKPEAEPAKKPEEPSSDNDENMVRPGETVEQAIARIRKNPRIHEVPARAPDEMKKFLDERLKELNDKIGGKWALIETDHYYCFANVPAPKHQLLAKDWNEALYKRLCEVLQHKDGDKLWNNKCPIYYFEKYSQFQQFAGEIDGSPGAGNSGGYFMHLGREVHICIPFMTQRFGEKEADRQARGTLYHEGTHAFLQLAGEDVPLARWLHEGMAQFMEFWLDDNAGYTTLNKDRGERAQFLMRKIGTGDVPSWSEMKMRPAGGTDSEGYAWAWARFEYFFRTFRKDPTMIPRMIKEIKAGKPEDEAINTVFKQPLEKLEADYRNRWLKATKDMGFKFQN